MRTTTMIAKCGCRFSQMSAAIKALLAALAIVVLLYALLSAAGAHDHGQFAAAGGPSKEWWDKLASGKGLCCSFADGVSVEDVDWDTDGGHYRVRLNGQWIVVPDAAVVTEPNKFGPAVVWPYQDIDGVTQIRVLAPYAPKGTSPLLKRDQGCDSF